MLVIDQGDGKFDLDLSFDNKPMTKNERKSLVKTKGDYFQSNTKPKMVEIPSDYSIFTYFSVKLQSSKLCFTKVKNLQSLDWVNKLA